MKILLSFLVSLLWCCTAKAQVYQPVNALNPDKNYTSESLQKAKYPTATALLQAIADDFDGNQVQSIAILLNGKYESRMLTDGTFQSSVTSERLNKKIVLDAIDHVEAHYNPNYNDPWKSGPYLGTIDLVIPAMDNPDIDPTQPPEQDPEPWNDPIVERLALASGEKPDKVKRSASTVLRAGITVGLLTRRGAVFAGLPLEVPLTKNLSIWTQPSWNFKSVRSPVQVAQGIVIYDTYTLQSFEPSLGLKLYITETYPHIYLSTGIFMERAVAKWTYNSQPSVEVIRQKETVFGVNIGAGVRFYSRLHVYMGWSPLINRRLDLPPSLAFRGMSIGMGWMLGKK